MKKTPESRTACEPLRLTVDFTILTLIKSLGNTQNEHDVRDRLSALRRELSRCLTTIEQSLGCPQSKRIGRYLRSLRTTLHEFLRALEQQGPTENVLGQAHTDLQLEPLTCPPRPAPGGNRIAGFFPEE